MSVASFREHLPVVGRHSKSVTGLGVTAGEWERVRKW